MRVVVSAVVYGAVAVAGAWHWLLDGGSVPRLLGFAAVMAVLFGLLRVEGRTAFAVSAVLFCVAVPLDTSGVSQALFLLIPYSGYLMFGRRAGLALAGACLAGVVAVLWRPGWAADPETVSGLSMFVIGLVLVCATAEAAGRLAELGAAAERVRLARDIHDSLGHHLTAVSVQLEKAEAFRALDQDTADAAVRAARGSARSALDEVRHSVRALREDLDLTGAVRGLVAQFGGAVSLEVSGTEKATPPAARTAVYRAAQEALTNARRHADAASVRVSLAFTAAEIRLAVTDDGRGMAEAEEGFGLRGMRERAALAGGRVRLDSGPGGTTVRVTVPR